MKNLGNSWAKRAETFLDHCPCLALYKYTPLIIPHSRSTQTTNVRMKSYWQHSAVIWSAFRCTTWFLVTSSHTACLLFSSKSVLEGSTFIITVECQVENEVDRHRILFGPFDSIKSPINTICGGFSSKKFKVIFIFQKIHIMIAWLRSFLSWI